MTEYNLEERMPILGIEEDRILSKQGDHTLCYQLTKPEIFSQSGAELAVLDQAFVRALKILPQGSIFHMQDWFVNRRWKGNFEKTGEDFLSHASDRAFHERPYLDHHCYLFLTKKPAGRKPVTAALSSLLRRRLVPEEALDEPGIQDFTDACGQFLRILQDSGKIGIRRLTEKEIRSSRQKAGVLEQYYQLAVDGPPTAADIHFGGGIRIGAKHCQLFTLGDAEDLPASCSPETGYDRYSTDKTKFNIGFVSPLGQLLSCNHLYSQYIIIGDQAATLKKLESRRLRLQSLSAYSRENSITHDAVNAFLNEAIGDQRQPVKAHFDILCWTDDPAELKEIRNKAGSVLSQLEVTPRLETAGAPQIWWAGIPGNAADLPEHDCFDTFLEQAACFLNLESCSQDSPSPFGLRLSDRLSGRPLHVDISDEPMSKGIITNRNKAVFGGSGSGKSMFMNHMMRSYYQQGAHCVIVDVGGSYKGLCEMLKGYYFTYEEKRPICFNPFYIAAGDILDTEKKESIKTLLLALWKKDDEQFRRSEYVALSNALTGYFDHLASDAGIFPGFNSFYEFLQSVFVTVLQEEKVKEKDFDVDNFLYVLRPYYKGGEFDFLLNARENLDVLQQRFIVFELDNVKDHPILFPVVTLIIMELFISKMRKLKGIRKVITIEEAWKAIARAGMAEFLKYLYKTVRKFFGEAIVVTQEVEDVISSPIVKEAILNNADCKILLDMRKFQHKFDGLQETLGMTDKGKMMVLSLNRANDPKRKYRELFIDLGGMSQKVYGFEPSPEEYYLYTTEEKEKVLVGQYAIRYGGIRQGIRMLLQEQSK